MIQRTTPGVLAPEVDDQRAVQRRRRVVDELRHRGAGEEILLRRLDARDHLRIVPEPAGQLGEDLGQALAQRVGGVGGDLSERRMQRGDQPVAIDQAEHVGHPDEDAGIHAHTAAIAPHHAVHQLAHGFPHVRPLQRLHQETGERVHGALVPSVTARDVDEVSEDGRRRPREDETAQPADELGGSLRRELARRPTGDRSHHGLHVPRLDARRSPGEQAGHVHLRDLAGDVLGGQHAVAHHRAHARGHELPVRRDQRGVRDGQPERAAEQRGHREPVGEAAHHARLRDGEDPPAPPGGAERKREDGERGGEQEDGEGELPLPAAGRRDRCGLHAVIGLSHADNRQAAPPAGGARATTAARPWHCRVALTYHQARRCAGRVIPSPPWGRGQGEGRSSKLTDRLDAR